MDIYIYILKYEDSKAYRCHKITTYMSSSDMFLKKFTKLYQDMYVLLVILIRCISFCLLDQCLSCKLVCQP